MKKKLLIFIFLIFSAICSSAQDVHRASEYFFVDTLHSVGNAAYLRLHQGVGRGHRPTADDMNIVMADAFEICKGISGGQLLAAAGSDELRRIALNECSRQAREHGFGGVAYVANGRTFVVFNGDTARYEIIKQSFPIVKGRLRQVMKMYLPALKQLVADDCILASGADVAEMMSVIDQMADADNAFSAMLTARAARQRASMSAADAVPDSVPTYAPEFFAEKLLSLYADSVSLPITDMSRTNIAVYDARKHSDGDVVTFMRRYFDNVVPSHPSVLGNKRKPTHFVVAAASHAEALAASELIRKYKDSTETQCVLLYAGDILPTDAWDDILPRFNSVFYEPPFVEKPFDYLSQAFFGGLEVGNASAEHRFASARLLPRCRAKIRLAYSKPFMADMSAEVLDSIDLIAKRMIADKASPGASVVVVRHGRVVFGRCYGNTSYSGGKPVDEYSLYDIASVSKIVGTLPLVMRLFDSGRLNADMTIGEILADVDATKRGITVGQLLSHTSGMAAGVSALMLCVDSTSATPPFFSRRRKSGYTTRVEQRLFLKDSLKLKSNVFSAVADEHFPVQIADNLFATDSFRLSVYKSIDRTQLLRPTYRYSDLNFIYLGRIIESMCGSTIDRLFLSDVARPLGICRLLYRPLEHFPRTQTVPTENDGYFRRSQIWGTVHDPTAAILGGVAGNAGLFGTANELAKIAQMFLNRGEYGGVRIVGNQTVDLFTRRNVSGCRRGYGFDKPEADSTKTSPVIDIASPNSYGHTGFTGTLLWIDPDADMIYIFLSNRVCPDASNNALTRTDVRSNIHRLIYNAITR